MNDLNAKRNWTVLINDTRFGHKSVIHLYEVTMASACRTADLIRNAHTDVSIVAGLK